MWIERLNYWLLMILFYVGTCCGQAQINWLKDQQDLHDSGLLESYQDNGDTNAFIFDQALAIIAFTEAGETSRARKILDMMEFLQNQEVDGAWDECYDANDPNLYIGYYKHVTGPVAWVIMAVNFYEDKTGDTSYAPVARTALGWLDTMQHMTISEERYGSLGWSDDDMNIISTEHNLDAFSAYYWRGMIDSNEIYLSKASLILDFLEREMWAPSPESNHWHDIFIFWRGLESPHFCTDPQSWGVLSLGPLGSAEQPFYKSLCWLLDPIDSTRNLQDYSDSITNVDGFKGCTGDAELIEVDFTEHVAAAFYSIGDDLNGDYFHNQMARIVDPNGGLIHSFSDSNPNIGYRYNYVASVAWYYFNEVKLNPFNLSSARNVAREANIDKRKLIDVSDLQILGAYWLDEDVNLPANINGEGRIDFLDFSILAKYWMCGCDE